jgi:hypothetical protein
MPSRPTRRTLLAAVGLGGWVVLTGCQEQPGSPAEVAPTDGAGRPIRSEAADVLVMFRTLERTRSLQLMAAGLLDGAPDSSTVPEIHDALSGQAEVLEELLRAAEVEPGPGPDRRPVSDDAAATSARGFGGADDSAATTGGIPRADRVATLADALADDAGAEALAEVAGTSPANLPVLLSLHGQRAAAAVLLRRTPDWPPLSGPEGAAAVGMLVALREVVYALEVAAARASGDERAEHEVVLSSMRTLTDRLVTLAGPAAPAPPLGYGLPGPVDSADARRALVVRTLEAVPAAVLDGSGGLVQDEVAVAGCTQVLAEVVSQAQRLGSPLPAFPGLRTP